MGFRKGGQEAGEYTTSPEAAVYKIAMLLIIMHTNNLYSKM